MGAAGAALPLLLYTRCALLAPSAGPGRVRQTVSSSVASLTASLQLCLVVVPICRLQVAAVL